MNLNRTQPGMNARQRITTRSFRLPPVILITGRGVDAANLHRLNPQASDRESRRACP